MRIVLAGGHGKIALLAAELLVRDGHQAVALIRNPDHAPELTALGAEPLVLDLEHAADGDLTDAVKGSDAIVFAAGAGPGSSAERKYTVDLGGSVRLADAAERASVSRFVQISAMGAGQDPAPGTDEVWAAYIDAKTKAETDLRTRDLDWTILRPGRLVDTEPTGLVTLGAPPVGRAEVSRADVAAVVVALLSPTTVSDTGAGSRPKSTTASLTLELIEGTTPIAEAVERVGGPSHTD
ncbi:NAD(P)-binding oxidoreductase [Nocardia callitridis]|uniref:NAD(P)H-binding protein n=1 Tax=Nocardia callitridis TaxID=648753 RepID=A0ABP9K5S4_9NOCA